MPHWEKCLSRCQKKIAPKNTVHFYTINDLYGNGRKKSFYIISVYENVGKKKSSKKNYYDNSSTHYFLIKVWGKQLS